VPSIRIHRDHALGLERAREIALHWTRQAEVKFDMSCKLLKGETSDTWDFTRSGCQGTLLVAPDHFALDVQLGLLLGAFAQRIESQIAGNLDRLLAAEAERVPEALADPVGLRGEA
jgi:putative polyhydroxyalkanoate system protein